MRRSAIDFSHQATFDSDTAGLRCRGRRCFCRLRCRRRLLSVLCGNRNGEGKKIRTSRSDNSTRHG